MPGRDDQPATVPPPAGEDDAYNAATKVGAMPAEIMAKLREEGLLPEPEGGGAAAVTSPPPADRASDAPETRRVEDPLATAAPSGQPPSAPSGGPAATASGHPPVPSAKPPADEIQMLPPLDADGLPRIRLDTPSSELPTSEPDVAAFPQASSGPSASAPPRVETPIAFASPSSSQAPAPGDGGPATAEALEQAGAEAPPARPRVRPAFLVFGLLVLVAFVVALLSQRG